MFCNGRSDILNTIWFSHEAHFHLDSYVNKWNAHYRALQDRETVTNNHLHPQQVTVWHTLSNNDTFGLASIKDIVGSRVSFNVLQNDSVPFPQVMVLIWVKHGFNKLAPGFTGSIVMHFF